MCEYTKIYGELFFSAFVLQETRYIFHAAGYVRVLIAVHSNIVLLHVRKASSVFLFYYILGIIFKYIYHVY